MSAGARIVLTLLVLMALCLLLGFPYELWIILRPVLANTEHVGWFTILASSFGALSVGTVLYLLKNSDNQIYYGFIEITIGIFTNLVSIISKQSDFLSIYSRVTILAVGIYIIVSGVGNFAEGLKKKNYKLLGINWAPIVNFLNYSNLREIFREARKQPTHVRVPKILIDRTIKDFMAHATPLEVYFKTGNNVFAGQQIGIINFIENENFRFFFNDGNSYSCSTKLPMTIENEWFKISNADGSTIWFSEMYRPEIGGLQILGEVI